CSGPSNAPAKRVQKSPRPAEQIPTAPVMPRRKLTEAEKEARRVRQAARCALFKQNMLDDNGRPRGNDVPANLVDSTANYFNINAAASQNNGNI
ncbi:hypothetical protein PFISCL1PPCAC_27921, partial [Pristionchus fissidentatus]